MKTIGELDTRDPNCMRCFGSGWVCENHPRRPWSDGPYYEAPEPYWGDLRLGCNCGAGMPCPDCNNLSDYGEKRRYAQGDDTAGRKG